MVGHETSFSWNAYIFLSDRHIMAELSRSIRELHSKYILEEREWKPCQLREDLEFRHVTPATARLGNVSTKEFSRNGYNEVPEINSLSRPHI